MTDHHGDALHSTVSLLSDIFLEDSPVEAVDKDRKVVANDHVDKAMKDALAKEGKDAEQKVKDNIRKYIKNMHLNQGVNPGEDLVAEKIIEDFQKNRHNGMPVKNAFIEALKTNCNFITEDGKVSIYLKHGIAEQIADKSGFNDSNGYTTETPILTLEEGDNIFTDIFGETKGKAILNNIGKNNVFDGVAGMGEGHDFLPTKEYNTIVAHGVANFMETTDKNGFLPTEGEVDDYIDGLDDKSLPDREKDALTAEVKSIYDKQAMDAKKAADDAGGILEGEMEGADQDKLGKIRDFAKFMTEGDSLPDKKSALDKVGDLGLSEGEEQQLTDTVEKAYLDKTYKEKLQKALDDVENKAQGKIDAKEKAEKDEAKKDAEKKDEAKKEGGKKDERKSAGDSDPSKDDNSGKGSASDPDTPKTDNPTILKELNNGSAGDPDTPSPKVPPPQSPDHNNGAGAGSPGGGHANEGGLSGWSVVGIVATCLLAVGALIAIIISICDRCHGGKGRGGKPAPSPAQTQAQPAARPRFLPTSVVGMPPGQSRFLPTNGVGESRFTTPGQHRDGLESFIHTNTESTTVLMPAAVTKKTYRQAPPHTHAQQASTPVGLNVSQVQHQPPFHAGMEEARKKVGKKRRSCC